MSSPTPGTPPPKFSRHPILILAPLLAGLFAILFLPCFSTGVTHFANDGPIGTLLARPYQLPDAYRGIWNDLLWLGAWNGNYNPNLTGLTMGAIGPTLYHKFMIPIGLSFLGLSAALCFHVFGMPRWVCVLGGLAAALNMNVFSNACWGLPSRAHAMGAAFLAIGALHSSFQRFPIVKAILAGLAIGLGISEGGDNGAIFAIVVGLYGLLHPFTTTDSTTAAGSTKTRLAQGFGRVALAAVIAAVFAAQTLNIFVNTAVKGVVGMSDDRMTPEQKWDFATQGSLHPKETLRVVIPGLYGYRMDAEHGGTYWGRVGESLSAPGKSRHSGAGEHAGVIVVLVALWAIHHSLRKTGSGFTPQQRRQVWAWAGLALLCLLLAWGKWGPLYRLLYSLPYFNTIRLPLKWMHPFHLCMLILFAHGLTALGKLYLARKAPAGGGATGSLGAWWRSAHPEERRWTRISIGLLVAALLGALIYAAGAGDLASRLSQANVAGVPAEIAAFSIHEVWLFVMFLAISVIVLLAIVSGRFQSRSLVPVAAGIGLLLGTDLVRANRHWMLFINYGERYASNPMLEFLKEKTTAYRVAKVPQEPIVAALRSIAQANSNNRAVMEQLQEQFNLFNLIYGYTHEQWQQNQFPYYNIPCLDMSQEPRLPADKLAFKTAMQNAAINGHPTREYEVTSTRYFVGLAGQSGILNSFLDANTKRFQEGPRFNLISTRPGSPYPGDLRVQADTNGPFAILEFTGALPRARLFSHWEAIADDAQAVARLGTADFDPARTVLVDGPIPPAPAAPNADVGEAVIAPSTTTHQLRVQVNATNPGVLLLTDRYDPAWKVTVDGQPSALLRCNYLMRGVQVPGGRHTVEFTYHPSMGGFWLMAGCIAFGLALLAYLAVRSRLA